MNAICDRLLALEEHKRELELDARQHQLAINGHTADRDGLLDEAQLLHDGIGDWKTLLRFRAEAAMGDEAASGLVEAAARRLGLPTIRRPSALGVSIVVEINEEALVSREAALCGAEEEG